LGFFDFTEEIAVSFERKIGLGTTDPVLMGCQNGHYIVKSANNIHGPRVLINEFVCYKLAKLLELPIPDASLIHVSEKIINSSSDLMELGMLPGIHFGSSFIQRANTNLQPPLIRLAQNKEDIPSIVLFDQIIYNDDRTRNRGNLMFDLKKKSLMIIDHSHVFKLGAIWDHHQLKLINDEAPQLINDFHGHNYKILLEYVNGYNPFHKIITKLKSLTRQDIEWCCDGIPETWMLSEKDKEGLIDFIWYRINIIDQILDLIKNECPDWKGGIYSE